MEGEEARRSGDDPRSRESSSTWGQFDGVAGSGTSAGASSQVQGVAMDEDEMLFTPGMSSPQVTYEGDGSQLSSALHKSPKENEFSSSGRAESARTSSSDGPVIECMKCSAPPPIVYSYPCGCYAICRKCAMKMATGGKCKFCKKFFSSFTSTRIITDGNDSDISD